MPGTPEPVLDLGSLNPERPIIRIDDVDYHLRVAMDINLAHLAALDEQKRRLDRLQAEKPPRSNVSQVARQEAIHDVLGRVVRLVMYEELPPAVIGKLNDIQRLAIMDAFSRATGRALSQANRKARRANGMPPRRSARSSRASAASTPAAAGTTG